MSEPDWEKITMFFDLISDSNRTTVLRIDNSFTAETLSIELSPLEVRLLTRHLPMNSARVEKSEDLYKRPDKK